jgi:micrococcal nuclease
MIMKDIIRGVVFILVLLIAAILGFRQIQPTKANSSSVVKLSLPFGKNYSYDNILVERVVDGDTLKLENGARVRLIGIDTPEMHDSAKLARDSQRTKQDVSTIKALGRQAYEFTKNLVENKRVRLVFDVEKKDKYGRLLAYVYIDLGLVDLKPQEGLYYVYDKGTSIFVNASIVSSGYASLMTYPPNVKYADLFLKLSQEARSKKRGLWKI